MKDLYFIYLAILRKLANNVALLKSTAGTSKSQVNNTETKTILMCLLIKTRSLHFLFFIIHIEGWSTELKITTCIFSSQEKYVGAICSEVFQKFPDFVHRCKDESFEALSDPMYSGKMKVWFKISLINTLFVVSKWINHTT